jgi:quinol monooxygenase YgiN
MSNDRPGRVVPEHALRGYAWGHTLGWPHRPSGGSTDEPIIAVDSSEIREGRIDELKAGLTELVEFVEANEAEPIAYRIYIDEDGTRMTVVQIHPNSASMELHMRLAGPIFQKFADLVVLTRIDFYGRPSDALVEQMRQKAGMLGNAVVVVNELHAGFARFGTEADAT